MNLSSTIAIFAGGFGSGCRGPNCGRKRTANPFKDSKIQQVVYHGTDKQFTRVQMNKGAQGVFWVSSDRSKIESGESGAVSNKHVLKMFVDVQRPAGWEEYDKLMLGQLKQNYDSVVLPESDGSFNVIVFKPSQVRVIK